MSNHQKDTGHSVPTDSAEAAPGHSHHEAHTKLYLFVGGALFFLTLVTVWLSYWDFGSHTRNIAVGMALATFKVSLVGAIFMHLKGEKPLIWKFLYFTAFFVLGLFLLTALAWIDPIFGTTRNLH
jgi:caa(3)-type oxidase subunit IV